VFEDRYIRPLAELFQKLGYERGLVVYGVDGVDEISNVGATRIAELSRDVIHEYIVKPEDLGIKRSSPSDIQATTRETSISDFLRVLYGKDTGPKLDLVAVNVAGALYVAGKAKSIRDGIDPAVSLIKSGKAAEKFEEYIRGQGDYARLTQWKSRAGI